MSLELEVANLIRKIKRAENLEAAVRVMVKDVDVTHEIDEKALEEVQRILKMD